MFEDSTSRNGIVAFVEDFVSLVKAYPVTAVLWTGSIPVWVYTFVKGAPYGSLPLFPLHAYFLTAAFLVENPIRAGMRNVGQNWFWAASLCGVPVHGSILVGLYYWDRAVPGITNFWSNPLASRLVVAGALEIVILDVIFDYFRPSARAPN